MERRLRNLWDTGDSAAARDPKHPCNMPFGGFDVFMFGDFKQLPPVGARPMYASVGERDMSKVKPTYRTTIEMTKAGHKAYRSINRVITLPESIRQKKKDDDQEDDHLEEHLDRIGLGECHSQLHRQPCAKTKLTDRQYWKDNLVNEFTPTDKDRKWIEDPKTITLVHTNAEALLISAEYAVRQSEEKDIHLWQWKATNTTAKARRAKMSDVGGLRNELGIFVGMQVMLLENACGGH